MGNKSLGAVGRSKAKDRTRRACEEADGGEREYLAGRRATVAILRTHLNGVARSS
jgi:hypothetical protein